MADKSSDKQAALHPTEPWELLKRLRLTTGKAAEFSGVSRRQLCYWTDTGIVPSVEGEEDDAGDSSRRTYDFDALHRVLLINQALEHAPGLRRAAREVDQYLSERRRRAEELAQSIEQKREDFLTEQADRLVSIADRIREVIPSLKDRKDMQEIYEGSVWLDDLADRVMSGEVLLEEDPAACLRLAQLVEQCEAKAGGLSLPKR